MEGLAVNRYVPMQGAFPGVQWVPSNSDVGYSFISDWCGTCARDKAAREAGGADLSGGEAGKCLECHKFPSAAQTCNSTVFVMGVPFTDL